MRWFDLPLCALTVLIIAVRVLATGHYGAIEWLF